MTNPHDGLIAALCFLAAYSLAFFLRVGECDQCPHCRGIREEKQRKKDESEHEVLHRIYGEEDCPRRCKR